MPLTSTSTGDFVAILFTFFVFFITYWKLSFQYWHRRNVPYLEPTIPFGNLTEALKGKENYGVNLRSIYKEMKARGWKYGGIYVFGKPQFIPLDLELVRNILAKDFHFFTDRMFFFNENEPLQNHLINLRGNRWRSLRSKLTPTFTSGKMKMMFEVMAGSERVLHRRMEEEIAKKEPIDIKEITACFTINIIGTCGFGLDCEALEDENSSFRTIGRKIFEVSYWSNFKQRFALAYPQLAKFLPNSSCLKNTAEFLTKVIRDTINFREENNITRNDFMQLLINLKNQPEGGKPLTLDEIASHCFLFFIAGFESSSALMTFALYELSKHQVIQDQVRNEIGRVLADHDNKLSYESIQDMQFVSQVIDETLRLHPPVPDTNRVCVQDYKVPGTDLVIQKGTIITIPIMGIHYDEHHYPDPSRFDPGRFSDKNRSLRNTYAYLPFGEGPRNCIAIRFGLLQAKMGLVALLRNYRFTINQAEIKLFWRFKGSCGWMPKK